MSKLYSIQSLLVGTALTMAFASPIYAQSNTVEDEVVVTGTFIPTPQKATSQVASFLEPEDLARQGDSDAAIALTRVSGISVVGGKFAYVRGLGDRYSAATLNGSPLPSTDPLRRTVPLDLFPTSVLDGISVQKTYSADAPAEFGGGLINMRTSRAVADRFVRAKLSTSFNSETTFKDGFTYEGGDYDVFGFDDGLRDLPDPIRGVLESGGDFDSFTPNQDAIVASLQIPELTTVTDDYNPFFDTGLSLTAARDMVIGGKDVFLTAAIGFDRDITTKSAQQNFATELTDISEELLVEKVADVTTVNSVINGLLTGAIDLDTDQTIFGTLLYIHDTDKIAKETIGVNNANGRDINERGAAWEERELYFSQIGGEHALFNFDIDWRASYSESARDVPFDNTGTAFNFSYLDDWLYSAGGEISRDFDFASSLITLTAGGSYSDLHRDFLSFDFTIDPVQNVVNLPTAPDAVYFGLLDTYAGFGKAEIEFSDAVRAEIGVRYEDAEQAVIIADRFGEAVLEDSAFLENDYVLPSASLTWNFLDNTQLRLAYSDTIGRPQFRELAVTKYTDPDFGGTREIRGNNNLVDTEFTNIDARIEHYFGARQYATFGLFYKDITNPIEDIQNPGSDGETVSSSFINAPKAEIFGFEADFRRNFSMPFEQAFFANRDWFFSANYTYTKSEIKAGAGDVITTFDDRLVSASDLGLDGSQMQGSPENIVNTQFGWEGDNDQFTLLVGWVDERILLRGAGDPSEINLDPLLAVIEDPGVQLDMTYKRNFNIGEREATFGLSLRNLLNQDNEQFLTNSKGERTEFNTYARGTSISASLSADF
ncbi:TonB-dependent receptor domain-containing protein [Hellea balneolensis]|uniref:TonB-dependent receptor domain-containing protein n=1 Tax=Hellea balneolensis TaxID=287478 RepID=UPI00041FB5DB|nr:TonB-dependent receptor [Hellea balneolensis]